MPQVQKKEVRDNIVDSARKEFLDKGFKNASMRTIALKSKVTVGNLYRYFRNKDELLEVIVEPAFKELNALLTSIVGDPIDIGSNPAQIDHSINELKEMVWELSDGLIDIYLRHKIELNILMMDSGLNRRILSWFTDTLNRMITASFPEIGSEETKLLAQSYAVGIFDGLKEMLRQNKLPRKDLVRTVNVYLGGFLDIMSLRMKERDNA